MTGEHTEWAGAIDRLDLIHVLLGNPDLPLSVEVSGRVFAVEDFRFSPGQGGVVLLLDRRPPTARLQDLPDPEELDFKETEAS